ncbi:MAG: FHA domain-containing protein, partial [Desulfobacterales bacterium]
MKKQIFNKKQSSNPPVISVHIEKGDTEKIDYHFSEPFRIGRDNSCHLQISDHMVSRFHAEILFIGGRWWIQDLQSANGTFVNGSKIDKVALDDQSHIELSNDGPVFTLT